MTKASESTSGFPIPQIVMVGAGLIALSIPFVGWRSLSPTTQEISGLSQPEADYVRQRVAALGRIEPASGAVSVGAPVNEIITALMVQEGDWVEQGEVVAALRTFSERKAELDAAEQSLATAQTRLQAETRYGRAQLAESAADYRALPAVQSNQQRAQRSVVNRLRQELSLKQGEFSRFEALYRKGAIAQNEIDQKQTEVVQLAERLQEAQATLQQIEAAGDRELANAQTQLNTLNVGIDRIQVQNEVDTALQNVQLAKARVDSTLIRSPISGEVLRIITQAGENVSDSGRGEAAILTLGNTRTMSAIAEVYESNIREIQVGQSAVISSRNDAFEGEVTGKVVAIGSQIFKKDVLNDDPTARVDARVVEVEVQLDNPEAVSHLTNLQVDVEIDTDANDV